MKQIIKRIVWSLILAVMLIGVFPIATEAAGTSPYVKIFTYGKAHRKDARTVLKLMNEERTKRGLKPLVMTDLQEAIAITRGVELSANFSHTRPDGSPYSSAWNELGAQFDAYCSGIGENVAMGQKTAKSVMNAWMSSPGHRANILDPGHTHVGVGCVEMYGQKYWVQYFTDYPSVTYPAEKSASNNYGIAHSYWIDTNYIRGCRIAFYKSKTKLKTGQKTDFDLAMYDRYGYPLGAVLSDSMDLENGAITFSKKKILSVRDSYIYADGNGGTGNVTLTAKVGNMKAKKTITVSCSHKKIDNNSGTLKPAGFGKSGKMSGKCEACGKAMGATIASVKTPSLSATSYLYKGTKITPSVTIKDSKGKKLKKGTDYDLEYSEGRVLPGMYSVKIKLKGNYSGSKTLKFKIVPKAPSTIKATLTGHDDVELTWKASEGAAGYLVYYKKSSASKYTKLIETKEVVCTKKNLSDGVKYTFKVVPYALSEGEKIYSTKQYKTTIITTKKNVLAPKTFNAKLYGENGVKLTWSKSKGASYYKVYYKKASSDTFKRLVTTKKTYYTKKNLSEGTEYIFKVVPCYGKSKTEGFYDKTLSIVIP